MTSRRQFILSSGSLAAGLALGASRAHAQALTELNFGIIATESQASARPHWTPFLADMERVVGMKVNGFYATDYAGVIEAMRFNRVQVAWFGNASAIVAVDRANGEVFVQSTYSTGREGNGYYSVLIVHRDSPIHSLDDIINSPGRYTFGNGDPNSTSGFLIPSYYAWAQHNIDIRRHFTRVITGSHEANLLAIANRTVDVATNNTEDMERFERNQPQRFAMIREVWRSVLIPSDPIVWRRDLADDIKTRVKGFFLGYGAPAAGKSEADVQRELGILRELQWGRFRESTNRQLLPIREVSLFRDRLRIENDERLSAEDKQRQLHDIDEQLAALRREMGT
jgi:phosphonate transport system substrate-binding protein